MTDAWPVERWTLFLTEEPRRIIAWEVLSEAEEDSAIWGVQCIAKAFDAGRTLTLVAPITAAEEGGYSYALFKRKGCEHCKRMDVAVVWRIVPHHPPSTMVYVTDGAGHALRGLRNLAAPIRVPKTFTNMDRADAEAVVQTLKASLARPVFHS